MSKKYKAGKLDSFSKLSFWGFSHASSHPDSREFDNDDTQTHDQHTSYLSFFLHGQNFWRIKFTPKNANFFALNL